MNIICAVYTSRLAVSERIFYAVPRAPYTPPQYCECRATIDNPDGAPYAQCTPSALVEMCRFDEGKKKYQVYVIYMALVFIHSVCNQHWSLDVSL